MKKILLYYPQITGDQESRPLYQGLPLSVMALAAQLNPDEYSIKIVDGRLEDSASPAICRWLGQDVVCVGISAITSYQIKDGLQFARMVRNIDSRIPIVWGGWHPSLMPEQTIKDELVDIVCVGQGEETLLELIDGLRRKTDLSAVPNLLYKAKDGSIIHTGIKHLKDFSSTKYINRAYPYIDMKEYIQPLWGNQRVIGYESSRGCPWRCKFCSIGSVYNGRWSALPAERIVDDVELLKRSYDIDAIHFYDNNFFVDPGRVKKFSSLLVDKGINIRWDGTAVVEQFIRFSDDFIQDIKNSGFFRVIVGVESGDEDVLKRIDKRHNTAQVLELVQKCKRNNIMLSLSFMVGFPWNPEGDFYKTLGLIENIKKIVPETEILLFIFSPYLGTALYDVATEYGMKFPESLEGWADYTYEKSNMPWISKKLLHKIDRYISFFGTKDMTTTARNFLKGKTE